MYTYKLNAPHHATSAPRALRRYARKRRITRRSILPIILALVSLLLLAASGTASGSSSSTKSNNFVNLHKPTPQQLIAAANKKLIAAANKEGSVTFYTQFNESDLKSMITLFNKTYPKIAVNTLTLNADDTVVRITTEQRGGLYATDVLTSDGLHMGELISTHAVQFHNPPSKPLLPSQLKLPVGFRAVAFITTETLVYNPKRLKAIGLTPPTSYNDLTTPQWKGNFSMPSNGYALYQSLINSMGHAQALDLIRALGKNKPRLVSSHSQAVTQVQAGEPAATISYGAYAAAAKKATPDSIEIANPNPLSTNVYLIGLATKAPHPAAARVFMNWFEAKTGQEALVKALGFSSLRTDVGNDPTIWNPKRWAPTYTSIQSVDDYNKTLQEYKSAIGAP